MLNRGGVEQDIEFPCLAGTLVVLEYVIRGTSINSSNLLANKTVQIAAYADDINIMSRPVSYTHLDVYKRQV